MGNDDVAGAEVTRVVPPSFEPAEHAPGAKRWVYRWFRWRMVFLAVFAVFWDVLVGAIVVGMPFSHGSVGWTGLFVSLPMVCAGIGVTWSAAAALVLDDR